MSGRLKNVATTIASIVAAYGLSAGVAHAEDAADPVWTLEAVYTADVTGVVHGAPEKAGRALDNLDIILDGDLERAAGWRGASAHLYLLNNTGGQPNELAGTLQGVDNIEVGRPRLRLYELWVEQKFAGDRAAVLAGLYDLNSEFYSTDTSGLLIAPPFGIGSELSASGPNGPSIFPSTALAVRAKVMGEGGLYGQVAALNAHANTLGDPDGPITNLNHGVLLIGQAGIGDSWRVSVGAWRYTKKQDDAREVMPNGDAAKSDAHGAYLLAEVPLSDGSADQASVSAFLRAGLSDGDTTDFQAGWQAGFLAEHVFPGRPDSAFSVGFEQGVLSSKGRANLRDAGVDAARTESSVEITYSDRVLPRLTLQPDLQLFHHTGGDKARDFTVVVGLRATVELH